MKEENEKGKPGKSKSVQYNEQKRGTKIVLAETLWGSFNFLWTLLGAPRLPSDYNYFFRRANFSRFPDFSAYKLWDFSPFFHVFMSSREKSYMVNWYRIISFKCPLKTSMCCVFQYNISHDMAHFYENFGFVSKILYGKLVLIF